MKLERNAETHIQTRRPFNRRPTARLPIGPGKGVGEEEGLGPQVNKFEQAWGTLTS